MVIEPSPIQDLDHLKKVWDNQMKTSWNAMRYILVLFSGTSLQKILLEYHVYKLYKHEMRRI